MEGSTGTTKEATTRPEWHVEECLGVEVVSWYLGVEVVSWYLGVEVVSWYLGVEEQDKDEDDQEINVHSVDPPGNAGQHASAYWRITQSDTSF